MDGLSELHSNFTYNKCIELIQLIDDDQDLVEFWKVLFAVFKQKGNKKLFFLAKSQGPEFADFILILDKLSLLGSPDEIPTMFGSDFTSIISVLKYML